MSKNPWGFLGFSFIEIWSKNLKNFVIVPQSKHQHHHHLKLLTTSRKSNNRQKTSIFYINNSLVFFHSYHFLKSPHKIKREKLFDWSTHYKDTFSSLFLPSSTVKQTNYQGNHKFNEEVQIRINNLFTGCHTEET